MLILFRVNFFLGWGIMILVKGAECPLTTISNLIYCNQMFLLTWASSMKPSISQQAWKKVTHGEGMPYALCYNLDRHDQSCIALFLELKVVG